MNKQDEDKANKIAEMSQYLSDFPHHKESVKYGAIEMAAWKEQQMIEKAVSWIGKNCIKYNEIVYLEDNNDVPTHIFHLENFIEDFKNIWRKTND